MGWDIRRCGCEAAAALHPGALCHLCGGQQSAVRAVHRFFWVPLTMRYLPPEHFLARWGPMLLSILLALPISYWISRLSARPIQEMLEATQAISRGDYTVRVSEEGSGDLAELLHSFNQMTNELGSTEMMCSDFICTFSHECKTPIASIRDFARRLRRGNLTPEQQNEYLDIIADESLRLSELSSSILLLAKYEAQSLVADQTDYDLDEQLRACVLRLESKWTGRGLTFSMQLPRLPYRGNSEMLGHVWMNLIDNAIKFSHDGGTIFISGRREADRLLVTVRDEGIGIRPEALGHIFDKFYQGEPSHASAGSGLGLALVKRILALCGGEITVESTPDAGSSFCVSLPAAD